MAFSPFNRTQDDATWSLARLTRPWPGDRVSILDFLRAGVAPDHDSPMELPDEEWLTDIRSIKFAPGVFDRTMRVNDTPEEAYAQANAVVHAVRGLSANASDRGLARLHAEITRRRMSEVLGIIEELLTETTFSRPDRVRAIAMLLVRESPDRDAVKVGLLLLGKTGMDRVDAADLLIIGGHGEFSRFAVEALRGRVDGWQQIAWEMAKRATGPGRSAAVAALEGATDPAIRQWLLEEGWRDSEYDESAAFCCATTGGLEEALGRGTVSLEAAGGLLQSLARAGMFRERGLRELPNGAQIVEQYVQKMAASEQALWQFDIARSLHLFVASRFAKWGEHPSPEWGPELRSRVADDCAGILRLPGWDELVWRELQNPDERSRRDAYVVAHLRNIDLWDYWWRLAQTDPDFDEWSRLTFRLNGARVDEFIALASERLKPAPGQGFGRLGSIAMAMARFPGKGWEFVRAAVWSANGLHSTQGLRTLGEWGAENWTGEMRAELERAAKFHAEARTREFAGEILGGEWKPPEPIEFDDEPEVWET